MHVKYLRVVNDVVKHKYIEELNPKSYLIGHLVEFRHSSNSIL